MSEAKVDSWVGRANQVDELSKLLGGQLDDKTPVQLISICGPGGIGKTYLFEHVYHGKQQEFATKNYLRLDIGKTVGVFPSIVNLFADECVTTCSARNNQGKRLRFPKLEKVANAHRVLQDKAIQEFESSINDKIDEDTRSVINILFKLGVVSAELYLKSNKLEFARIAKKITEKNSSLIDSAISEVSKRTSSLIKNVWWSRSIYKKIRSNVQDLVADSFIADLTEILTSEDNPYKNLLFVVDNFESNSTITAPFLVEEILPRLRGAGFYSTVVVIGRDNLKYANDYMMDKGANSVTQFHMGREIMLSKFSPEEAESFIRSRKITDKEKIAKIIADSKCVPFLLDLIAKPLSEGGDSASAVKAFFRRSTYFMNEEQKQWFIELCFLDYVDEVRIGELFSDQSTAKREEIWKWFDSEGGIKYQDKHWKIIPVIQETVQNYIENRNELDHANMQRKAQEAIERAKVKIAQARKSGSS